MINKKHAFHKGFILLEIIISLLVISLTFLSVTASFQTYSNFLKKAKHYATLLTTGNNLAARLTPTLPANATISPYSIPGSGKIYQKLEIKLNDSDTLIYIKQ